MLHQITSFIIEHWALSFTLFVILVSLLVLEFGMRRTEGLSAQKVVALMNHSDALMIDLRDQKAYGEARIMGTMHASKIEQVITSVAKHRSQGDAESLPVVLVCAQGLESRKMVQKLQQFEHVYFLNGGLSAWKQANLPLERGKKS